VGQASGRTVEGYVSIIPPFTYSNPISLEDADSEDDEDDEEEPEMGRVQTSDKSVPWDLARDAEGWPVLPAEMKFPLQESKEIVRSFVTLTYRKHQFIPHSLWGLNNT
jgi:hypothetical protein